MEVTNSRTPKEFWQARSYNAAPDPSPESEVQPVFDRFLPTRTDWSVIEIGACPGSHLLALARTHRFHPVALDFLSQVHALPALFKKHGIEDLEVIEGDFLSFEAPRRFNVVMSFGFIEHFNDAEEVLHKHWRLVAEDGFLILGLPLFGPMQMALRRLILTHERLEETLKTHNTRAMDLRVLGEWCRQLPSSKVLKCSYVGQMGTWFYASDPYVRKERRWILWAWKIAAILPGILNISCRLFSPNGVLVVQRAAGSPQDGKDYAKSPISLPTIRAS
jgi:SAM-dependent methyltransferase